MYECQVGGYVYVMSNPSMPGAVKVGLTTRDVSERARELWTTGIPTPFIEEFSVRVSDCVSVEREVHGKLREKRIHESREFFRCSALHASWQVFSSAIDELSQGMTVREQASLSRMLRHIADVIEEGGC